MCTVGEGEWLRFIFAFEGLRVGDARRGRRGLLGHQRTSGGTRRLAGRLPATSWVLERLG